MGVSAFLVLPFIVFILSLAFLPSKFPKWWGKYFYYVSISFASVVITYYVLINRISDVLHSSSDYIMFISLITSLYIISGGILIEIKKLSTPFRNVVLLFIGALISNIIGTIGASMLLIRPYIRTNESRISQYHIVFFIFIVSNIGGVLTPIGNPPLFIGYLKGIPFLWNLLNLSLPWLITMISVLAIFYFIDNENFKKQSKDKVNFDESPNEKGSIKGYMNIAFLIIVSGCIFIESKFFIREIVMLLFAYISYRSTTKEVHKKNHFNFLPIKEVCGIFFGIFITITPVLYFLSHNSLSINAGTPGFFYWMTGILSAFLDNAPAFLIALSASMGMLGKDVNIYSDVSGFLRQHGNYVTAISIASVFFGAFTYIGNGPNFMVKSVTESYKIKIPGFFGFIVKYSLPILLPVYVLIWLLFYY